MIAVWHLGGWWQLGRLRRVGMREAPEAAQQMLSGLLRRFAIRRPVRLLVSARVAVPALIGWLRPVILLPASVLAELPLQHLELILAHELAHLRRCDYLLNLLQTAIETLLFYHPAVWWVSRQIRVERESCCDEQAAAAGDRLSYARALTALAELCREPRLASPGLALRADGGPFSARTRRVLKRPVRDTAATPARLGGLAALVLIAAMAGTMAWAGKASNNEVGRRNGRRRAARISAERKRWRIGDGGRSGQAGRQPRQRLWGGGQGRAQAARSGSATRTTPSPDCGPLARTSTRRSLSFPDIHRLADCAPYTPVRTS